MDWLWERLWTGFGRGCGLALGKAVDLSQGRLQGGGDDDGDDDDDCTCYFRFIATPKNQ